MDQVQQIMRFQKLQIVYTPQFGAVGINHLFIEQGVFKKNLSFPALGFAAFFE